MLLITNFPRNTLHKKKNSPLKRVTRGMWSRSGSGNNGKNLWKVLETIAYSSPKNARRGFHTKKESENEENLPKPGRPEKPKIFTSYWISKVETEKEKYNPSKKEECDQNYATAADLESQSNVSSSKEMESEQIEPQQEPVDLVSHTMSHPQIIETLNKDKEITPHISLTHHPLSKEAQDKIGLEMVHCEKLSPDPDGKTQFGTSFNRERTAEEKSQMYYNKKLTTHFYGNKPRDLLDPEKDSHFIENYKRTDRLRDNAIEARNKMRQILKEKQVELEKSNNTKNQEKNENNENNHDNKNT